ncbi:MAG: MmcQ/YjbR family DNA-binding protein [Vallitalea sp.]|jgi:predicted DNA-binding protein (MmcQ/YjbR family)|nr:MmcQ/YjbR family DNA-binding protein [Vallitalea sp.]
MLTKEEIRNYILSKPGAFEDFPFGDDVPVFKVAKKMFALFNSDGDNLKINLKCDPSEALYLRETFDAIIPGYHMNKKHWNTVIIDGSLPDEMVKELIDKSYKLVFSKLKKDEKIMINNL